MNVQDLIEMLQQMDPTKEAMLPSRDGVGFESIQSVDVECDRSPYDQDFDKYVVVIRP